MFNTSFFSQEEFPQVCKALLALTGYDITNAILSSGGKNVTYIIQNHICPVAIRISPVTKSRKDVLSELLFVDYLREHIHTICQPHPINNSLVNELELCGKPYYIVLFRKANGISPVIGNVTEHIYTLMGEKLANIHLASKRATLENFTFRRNAFDNLPRFDFNNPALAELLPAALIPHMHQVYADITRMERTPENFGMLHSDFHPGNVFVDWEDVWVFDFDDCHYGFFLYDIATACISPIMGVYADPPSFSAQTVHNICQAFFQGYSAVIPAAAPLLNAKNLMPFIHLALYTMLNAFTNCTIPANLLQVYTATMIKVLSADFSALL